MDSIISFAASLVCALIAITEYQRFRCTRTNSKRTTALVFAIVFTAFSVSDLWLGAKGFIDLVNR